MNLILVAPSDRVDENTVRLEGRRCQHIREILRAGRGDVLRVGMLHGLMGTGTVQSASPESIVLNLNLTEAPPAPLPVTLILALPRPKSFRRVIQCAVTLGVKRIALFGAYRVEKSYWQSPWLEEAGLLEQVMLGLEQARDTIPPVITMHPLLKPFVEDTLPGLTAGSRRLVAHPGQRVTCPGCLQEPVSLAIGPEGGFTDYEVGLLTGLAFEAVTLGPRILRTEQAVPAFMGRLMSAS